MLTYGHADLLAISCSANCLSPSNRCKQCTFFHRPPHEGGRLNSHSTFGGGAEGCMFSFLPPTPLCSVLGVGSLTFTHWGYIVGHTFHFQFVIYTRGEGLTHSANKIGVRSSPHDLFHPTGLWSWGLGCIRTSLHVYCPVNFPCVLDWFITEIKL